ncbi:type II toxin-antitoxin system VapC family toxin [Candidatus Peregrinibacteria bacterium]|nr:type II toxin-antitoxin system VapC family toxin [Candidatus Peregrinibacteria bacterium]
MYVIDTDILIDYLRLHDKAINFLDNLKRKERHIAFLTVFELINGYNNKNQEKKINNFLENFVTLDLNTNIAKTALQIYKTKKWSTGLGIADSLIAATAIKHKYALVTRNIKHYQNIADLKVKKPY